jgi:hypothetical protein
LAPERATWQRRRLAESARRTWIPGLSDKPR